MRTGRSACATSERNRRGRVILNVMSKAGMSLFAKVEAETIAASAPLAERMRPRSLEEFAGQQALLGPGKPLRVAIETDDFGSMILWGPPGCGKTTLARLIARRTNSEFVSFSAVLTGIREIKDVMAAAEHSRRSGRRTIVFVDEVHRFNKAQQDAFLPHVEAGNIIFIGATTENPSFEVIAPLLSRTRVYTLQALTNPELIGLLRRALSDKERGYGTEKVEAREGVLERMAIFANGDARAAYNTLEALVRAVAPAADFVGVPEGNLALAQAAVYLALAPKSNALYTGYDEAQKDLQNTAAEPVPLHLRNAATGLMRHEGYGRGYQYAHDVPDKVADMECLPPSLAERRYYRPGEEGFEQRLRERMEEIRGIKSRRGSGPAKT